MNVSDTCEQCGGEDTRHGVCSDCIGVPTEWWDVAGAVIGALR